jgi:hypothetical protein
MIIYTIIVRPHLPLRAIMKCESAKGHIDKNCLQADIIFKAVRDFKLLIPIVIINIFIFQKMNEVECFSYE